MIDKRYKINKKSGIIRYGYHILATWKNDYLSFNDEMDYSKEDIENIYHLIRNI